MRRNSPFTVVACAMGLGSSLVSGCSSAGGSTKDSSVWWKSHELTRDAIVGYLEFRHEQPVVASNAEFYSEIVSTILLFDEWDSTESMATLVGLGSYYLGAHGGELFSCVVVRKGSAIRPILDSVRASHGNECANRLGSASPVCLGQQAYESQLEQMGQRIEGGERCEVER